ALALASRRLSIPAHRRHKLARTQVLLRRAMALQTPGHRQRLDLTNLLHLVDTAMARLAGDPFIDMGRVVEVHEVGYIVDLNPGDRVPRLEALLHQGQLGTIASDRSVAVEAGLGWRNGSERRRLHC